MKQEHVLQHDADLLAQAFQLYPTRVDAIQLHRTGDRIVEARDQAGQRGFSDPGRADQRYHLPGRNLDIDVLQHHIALVVAEADVLKRDRALRPSFQPDRTGMFAHLRTLAQQLVHPVTAGQCFLNTLPGVAQHADRVIQHLQVEEKSDQVGHWQRPIVDQHPAKVDHHQDAQRRGEID